MHQESQSDRGARGCQLHETGTGRKRADNKDIGHTNEIVRQQMQPQSRVVVEGPLADDALLPDRLSLILPRCDAIKKSRCKSQKYGVRRSFPLKERAPIAKRNCSVPDSNWRPSDFCN